MLFFCRTFKYFKGRSYYLLTLPDSEKQYLSFDKSVGATPIQTQGDFPSCICRSEQMSARTVGQGEVRYSGAPYAAVSSLE